MGAKQAKVPELIQMTLPSEIEQVRCVSRKVGIGVEDTVTLLVRYGLEAMQVKVARLADLSERLHVAEDPGERDRLGDKLGKEIFG